MTSTTPSLSNSPSPSLPPQQRESHSRAVPSGVGGEPTQMHYTSHSLTNFFFTIWSGVISKLFSLFPSLKKVEITPYPLPEPEITGDRKIDLINFLEKKLDSRSDISNDKAREEIRAFRDQTYLQELAKAYLQKDLPPQDLMSLYNNEDLNFRALYNSALYLEVKNKVSEVSNSQTNLKKKLELLLKLLPIGGMTRERQNKIQVQFCYVLNASTLQTGLAEKMAKIDRDEFQGKLGFAVNYQTESLIESYLNEGQADFYFIRLTLERWLDEITLTDKFTSLASKLSLLSKRCSRPNLMSFISIESQKQGLERYLDKNIDYTTISLQKIKEKVQEWHQWA